MSAAKRFVEAYPYVDAAGKPLFEVVRFEPKDFRQRTPNGNGGWRWGLNGTAPVLYRLDRLAKASRDTLVILVEGERDVHSVESLGLLGTTAPMGAGKWNPSYSESLRGFCVYILPDNDEPGRKHADTVAKALAGIAESVTIVELSGLPWKGDISDWVKMPGNDCAKLLQLCDEARKQQRFTFTPGDAYEGPVNGPGDTQIVSDANEPWEPPIPLVETPEAEAFPLDTLPHALAQFVKAVALAKNCPPDYAAVPLLTIAGAAIGASRVLEIKPGWHERPCLYAAVIGPPGSAKTPALKAVAAPVYAEQSRRMANYRRLRVAWEEASDEEKPPAPKLETVFVSDITTEKMGVTLRDNQRGVPMIRDELTGWVNALDQYRKGKGADRQFYLSAWAGEPIRVDRKGEAEPLIVPRPFVSVIGGLPPALLSHLRGKEDVWDGFLDRILMSYPAPLPAQGEDWLCLDDEVASCWRETLDRLWALQPEIGEGEDSNPRVVRLTIEGRRAWEAFTARLAADQNREDLTDAFKGHLAKFKGYCARLALILQFLRLVCGETQEENVEGESVERAARLIAYFRSHCLKVHAVLGSDPEVENARRVLDWIRRERPDTFKRHDVFQDVKNKATFQRVEDLDGPLDRLEKHRMIRRLVHPSESAKGRGRPPAPIFEVNPAVYIPSTKS